MSDLATLLLPDNVWVDVKVNCKREALSFLAEKGAEASGLAAQDVLQVLQEREKLGSTGVGEGFAIPHGKLTGLDRMVSVLVHFSSGVDFDAVDEKPVDLMFMLLAPEDASAIHLKMLSKVARLMRSSDVREAMRGAETAEALYAIATATDKSVAA